MTRAVTRRLMLAAGVSLYALGALRFVRALPALEFAFVHAVFLVATLGIVLLLLANAATRRGTPLACYRSQFRLAIISVLLMLVGTEAWLRFGWGFYVNTQEQTLGHYKTLHLSIEQMKGPNVRRQRSFLYPPHLDATETFPEFTYRRRTNALGLRGSEIEPHAAPGVFRIINIGDSFTEGFGVSETETWSAQLEQMLASRMPGQRVESINAGIAGSDPVFGHNLLKEVLAPLRPDLVIQAISSNDLSDLCARGGFERYQTDGSVVLKPGPSWEWLYAASHLVRHVTHTFLGYDRMLHSNQERQSCEASARDTVRDAIDKSCRVAEAAGFSLAVVINPMVYEMETGYFQMDDLWKGHPPACANVVWLRHWFTQHGVRKDNVDEFYFPLDRHHTARGNQIFAEGVMDHIVRAELFPHTRPAS